MIQSDLSQVGLKNAQVLIDFTRPEGTMAHVKVCRQLGVKMVIGTTGFSEAQKAEIQIGQSRYCHRHGTQYERRRERHFEVVGDGRRGFGQPITTLKSSKHITAIK